MPDVDPEVLEDIELLSNDCDWWARMIESYDGELARLESLRLSTLLLRDEAATMLSRKIGERRDLKVSAGLLVKVVSYYDARRVQRRHERVQEYIDTGLFNARQAVVADMLTHPEAWKFRGVVRYVDMSDGHVASA